MDENKPMVKPCPLTISLEPENQETPIHFVEDWVTPEEFFYKRNHFRYPSASEAPTTLQIDGIVQRPLVFDLEQLCKLPSKTLAVPLECAGNKRTMYHPRVYGVQWQKGAISQGIWKGVPLHVLLERAGIQSGAKEIVFTGADRGNHTAYQRSLPVDKAMHPDTIVAYELNGASIPLKHGFPFRLIVPGWYAMASVKWLCRISVIDQSFEGPFQTTDYMYYPHPDSDDGKSPVTTMKVNSIIRQPQDYDILARGTNLIKGIAWTGEGRISEVEVSTDNGVSWEPATLLGDSRHPYAWVFWSYEWEAKQKGEYVILARARDSAGRVQPMQPEWNRKGYGYNGVSRIRVKVD
ncbi:sulfite oxidase [Lihuaxuella thermophila]|uniref:Mo-co oxidoreductase dimerisation domain-containing protein n=1 Tax=Lihuaxuella thermophila TaxID=1173111 RepID=A0A1H8J2X2_9BACL|nr:sulfite oxidase [Lihuaxuella thermophila]SEN75184.1 Mo-co oxidoreductase dimerisation domain-containing protein [Lihuaxuella thermophila]